MTQEIKQPKYITLLSLNPTALGIIRNLRNSGIDIIVLSVKDHPFANSRQITSIFPVSFEEKPEATLKFLVEIAHIKNKGFLIPSSDAEIAFLSKYRELLEKYYVISLAKEKTIRIINDKFTFFNALNTLSIKTPMSLLIDSVSAINTVKSTLGYPCLVKSVYSKDWKSDQASKVVGNNKVFIVNDSSHLKRIYKKISILSPKIMAQEIIDTGKNGSYSFCSYSDQKGNVLCGFVTAKSLMFPEKFGTALMCNTIKNLKVYSFGKKVVEALGIDGIAETEIVQDSQTGELHVIEINTRHWMQHRLSSRLGINYTLLDFYVRFDHKNRNRMNKMLSKNIWTSKPVVMIDEIGYFIHCIKKKFRLKECRFENFSGHLIEFSVLSVKDPLPFFFQLKNILYKNISYFLCNFLK